MQFKFIFPLSAVLLLTLSACDSGSGYITDPFAACKLGYMKPDLAAQGLALSDARSKWKAAGIASYTYEHTHNGEYGLAVKVEVKAGQVTLTTLLDPVTGSTSGLSAGESKTIDERFDDLAALVEAAGRSTQPCKVLSLSFDATDGHPLKAMFGNADQTLQNGVAQRDILNFIRL